MTFVEGSQLERIGENCFYGTAIKEFRAPQSLREVGSGAFAGCKGLERVALNEGLEKLGECGDGEYRIGVFSGAKIQ